MSFSHGMSKALNEVVGADTDSLNNIKLYVHILTSSERRYNTAGIY